MYTCYAADMENRNKDVVKKYQARVASPVIACAIRRALQVAAEREMHDQLAEAHRKGIDTHVGKLYPDVYKFMMLRGQFTQM